MAWEFAEEKGMDVVTIHLSMCLTDWDRCCSRDSRQLHCFAAALAGLHQDAGVPLARRSAHVKDAAKAQVPLFKTPQDSSRNLCTNGVYHCGDIVSRVPKLFQEFPVHRFTGETQPRLTSCKDAAKRLIDLGLVFTQVEDAVRETIESLRSQGFL